MRQRILVVDDQASICEHISTLLRSEGYEVTVAYNPEQALDRLSAQAFDVLLADMKMPGMSGLELFKVARKIDPDLSCVIMTAFGSISSAVASIKEGVSDYIQKPFEPEALLIAVEKTVNGREMIREIRDLRKEVSQRYAFGNMIGKNVAMQNVYDLIEKVAKTDARILITGETGVGKELVAKAIHYNSLRNKRPFVALNCGALPESLLESELFGYEKGAFTGAGQSRPGKFEYAQGGTIFLDEVGDISAAMQVKLLRVLQERVFERVGSNEPISSDVRIISATNQNLEEKIEARQFRTDLFYRLNTVPIHIPPLRERKDDIPLLVEHFMEVFNKALGKNIHKISSRAMNQLMTYDWPGNVRELENVIERQFVTVEGDSVEEIILPGSGGAVTAAEPLEGMGVGLPFEVARSMILRRFEKTYLSDALQRHRGNVAEAAKGTGINQRTLWRKLKEYGLKRVSFVP
ncbi:MAG: sigma-54-dependent Fis family transcriptional regulator [Deltaproteobacteria bacterium]|nr:sigma-54-dependent Fis family transcriptional regulator [Deltaproteobacteria bacterium]